MRHMLNCSYKPMANKCVNHFNEIMILTIKLTNYGIFLRIELCGNIFALFLSVSFDLINF